MTLPPSMGVKERYRGRKKDSRDGNAVSELNSPDTQSSHPTAPVRGAARSHLSVSEGSVLLTCQFPSRRLSFISFHRQQGFQQCASNETSLQERMGEVWYNVLQRENVPPLWKVRGSGPPPSSHSSRPGHEGGPKGREELQSPGKSCSRTDSLHCL